MAKGKKIQWTKKKDDRLRELFPYEFNDDVAKALKVSPRSVTRRARELGLEKAPDFREVNAEALSKRLRKGIKNGRPNPTKFKKGKELTGQPFKKGHRLTEEQKRKQSDSMRKTHAAMDTRKKKKIAENKSKTMSELWAKDRVRAKYGLKQKTKLRLGKKYEGYPSLY